MTDLLYKMWVRKSLWKVYDERNVLVTSKDSFRVPLSLHWFAWLCHCRTSWGVFVQKGSWCLFWPKFLCWKTCMSTYSFVAEFVRTVLSGEASHSRTCHFRLWESPERLCRTWNTKHIHRLTSSRFDAEQQHDIHCRIYIYIKCMITAMTLSHCSCLNFMMMSIRITHIALQQENSFALFCLCYIINKTRRYDDDLGLSLHLVLGNGLDSSKAVMDFDMSCAFGIISCFFRFLFIASFLESVKGFQRWLLLCLLILNCINFAVKNSLS